MSAGCWDKPHNIVESLPNDLHERFRDMVNCVDSTDDAHFRPKLEMLLDMQRIRLARISRIGRYPDHSTRFLLDSSNPGVPSGYFAFYPLVSPY